MDDDGGADEPEHNARVVVLPPEHWVLVFCFLDILALGKVAQVSASWNELASLPTVWRPQLVRHYSPLALSIVRKNDFKEAFRRSKMTNMHGNWTIRAIAEPYYNVDVVAQHRTVKKGNFRLLHDGSHLNMRNVFLAYGIQLGCFASVIYVTVANDTIHVDVREVVDNESTFGHFSVLLKDRSDYSIGFLASHRHREPVPDDVYDDFHDRGCLTKDRAQQFAFLDNHWQCTLLLENGVELRDEIFLAPDPVSAETFIGRRGPFDIPQPKHYTALAKVHVKGAMNIFCCSTDWPPSYFWSALSYTCDQGDSINGIAVVYLNDKLQCAKLSATPISTGDSRSSSEPPLKRARKE